MRYVLFSLFFVALSAGAQSTLPPPEKNPKWEVAREVATAMREIADKRDIQKTAPRERMLQVDAVAKRVQSVFGGDVTSPRFGRCHQAVTWLGDVVTKQNMLVHGISPKAHDLEQLTISSVRFGDEWRSCRNAVNDLDVASVKK